MGIGLGILLLVLGAIFTFALQVDIPGLGDSTLGLILMGTGLLTALFLFGAVGALVLSFMKTHQRQNQRHVVESRGRGTGDSFQQRAPAHQRPRPPVDQGGPGNFTV